MLVVAKKDACSLVCVWRHTFPFSCLGLAGLLPIHTTPSRSPSPTQKTGSLGQFGQVPLLPLLLGGWIEFYGLLGRRTKEEEESPKVGDAGKERRKKGMRVCGGKEGREEWQFGGSGGVIWDKEEEPPTLSPFPKTFLFVGGCGEAFSCGLDGRGIFLIADGLGICVAV